MNKKPEIPSRTSIGYIKLLEKLKEIRIMEREKTMEESTINSSDSSEEYIIVEIPDTKD